VGNKLAYVLNHDIYMLEVSTGTTIRITYDGSNDVFNGLADWVYEGSTLHYVKVD